MKQNTNARNIIKPNSYSNLIFFSLFSYSDNQKTLVKKDGFIAISLFDVVTIK